MLAGQGKEGRQGQANDEGNEQRDEQGAGLAREAGVPFTASSLGGVFGFFFHPGPVRSYADAQKCDTAAFRSFFHAMLEQGIYLAPSPFEAGFLTCAHGDSELDQTLEAARRAFAQAT